MDPKRFLVCALVAAFTLLGVGCSSGDGKDASASCPRANGFVDPEIGDVSVVYAFATLRLTLPDDRAFVNRPRRLPMFHHRPAWVIISPMGPFFGCRAEVITNSSAPERQRVELIAADGSGDGLLYRTGGSLCEQAVRPQVAVATYDVSLPWTVVSRTGSRIVIRYAAPPACGAQDGVNITSSPTSVMFDVEASVLLASPPCSPLRPASRSWNPRHRPQRFCTQQPGRLSSRD